MTIGICLLAHQIIFIINSLCSFFNIRLPLVIDIMLSSTYQGFHLSIISLISLLTLNAFDVFYKQKFFINVNRKTFFKYGIFICFAFSGILTIIYKIKNDHLRYSLYYLGYEGENGINEYNLGNEFESKYTIIFLSVSFLIYISIIIKILKMRKLIAKNNKILFYWSDTKFLLQTLFNFFFYILFEIMWKYGIYLLPDSRYSEIAINKSFRLSCCINTFFIALTINEIRKEIICLLVCTNCSTKLLCNNE